MGRKKKDYGFKPHERTPGSADNHHLRITQDMMKSKAWKALSVYARVIFQEMKLKYTGRNDDDIVITITEAMEALGSSKRTANAAIDQLVEYGFIRIVKLQWTIRKPNVYGFSAEWQRYGTNNFTAKPRVRTGKKSTLESHE